MKKQIFTIILAVIVTIGSIPVSAALDCGDAEDYQFSGSTYMTYPLTAYTQFPNGETPWKFEYVLHSDNSALLMSKYLNHWSHNATDAMANFDYGSIGVSYSSFHSGRLADPRLSFVCPYDGDILLPQATVYVQNTSRDGTKIRLTLNDYCIYPSDGWKLLAPGETYTFPETKLRVKAGDVLSWQVNKVDNTSADSTRWNNISVSYVSDSQSAIGLGNGVVSPFPADISFTDPESAANQYHALMENGAGTWYFQNCEVDTNNYLNLSYISGGWYGGWHQNWGPGTITNGNNCHPGKGGDSVWTYVCPKDGLLTLPRSQVSSTSATSRDGVRVKILNNNTPLYPASGWIKVAPATSVTIPELLFAVKAGDQIHFRVNCGTNQDGDATAWSPKVRYASSNSYVPVHFTDIKGHWAEDVVMEMYEQGLVSGRSNTFFAPDEPVTRAEFLTMASRAVGGSESELIDSFSDVPFTSWYAKSILTANQNNLIDYALIDGKQIFPDQGITREEAASVMVKAHVFRKRQLISEADLTAYTDAHEITSWAEPYMAKAVSLGMIQGNNNLLSPTHVLTRAEGAQLLRNLVQALASEDPEGTLSKVYRDKDGNYLPVYQNTDLEKMILDAYSSGADSITIPKGVYRMSAKVNGVCIFLEGLKDFTIHANDVVLSCKSPTSSTFTLSNCENVQLYGLTIDRESSSTYQGIIRNIDENGMYFDAWIDPAYVPNMLDERFINKSDSTLSYFTPEGKLLPNSGGRNLDGNLRKIGNDLYRFYISQTTENANMKVGDLIAGRASTGDNIFIKNCSGTYIQDVTVYNGLEGIFDNNAEKGATLENFQVTLGPKYETATMPRLRSVNGTGYFARGTRQGGILNNCKITHTFDDGINIHASYDRVAAIEANNTYIIGASGTTEPFRIGDILRFTSPDGVVRGQSEILSVTKLSGYSANFSGFNAVGGYFRVQLKEIIPNTLFGDRSCNLNTLSDGMQITNCYFEGNSPRAILIHATNALIENCTFKDTRRWAILAAPELPTWNEADYVSDLTIRGCTFEGNSRGNNELTSAIGIWGDNKNGSYSNENITITGNTFNRNYSYDILLSFVNGATVTGNTFGPQAENYADYGLPETASVFVFNDANVNISGNTKTANRTEVFYGVDGTLNGK